jgi:hypothetical protein
VSSRGVADARAASTALANPRGADQSPGISGVGARRPRSSRPIGVARIRAGSRKVRRIILVHDNRIDRKVMAGSILRMIEVAEVHQRTPLAVLTELHIVLEISPRVFIFASCDDDRFVSWQFTNHAPDFSAERYRRVLLRRTDCSLYRGSRHRIGRSRHRRGHGRSSPSASLFFGTSHRDLEVAAKDAAKEANRGDQYSAEEANPSCPVATSPSLWIAVAARIQPVVGRHYTHLLPRGYGLGRLSEQTAVVRIGRLPQFVSAQPSGRNPAAPRPHNSNPCPHTEH